MRFKKSFLENSSSLQNHFTAYLVTALHYKRCNIITIRVKRQQYEFATNFHDLPIAQNINNQDVNNGCTSIEQMVFESEKLEQAIWSLKPRERFVLFNRALAERSFDEIAADLNLSYKGVSAIYYRSMQKIRKHMGGDQK